MSARAQETNLHPIASAANCLLHPALQISLFAAEPDVLDPVAIAFDDEGRAYVVEMRDYPLGIGPGREPGGTIRLLEDTDGDGKADRSVVFASGLRFPTSVLPWNGGILVTAPPDILFLKDTNGDGKADVREVVLTGFKVGVTDSNVNGLRWGLDNRVHGANGGNSGVISSPRKPGASTPLKDLDFSFDPATGDVTTTFQTGGGFGVVFGEWGRSFTTYNINHVQHRVFPRRYLERFPGLPPVDTTVNIADHGEAARIYPIATAETRVNHPEQAGHFSAAGGIGYIGVRSFPGDLMGSVLVCDVVGNLVHRDVLSLEGASFVARRPVTEQMREFFASSDNAFRPTGVELGPDGALYLLDMQRDVIEHPDYIPEKVKAKLDLRAGETRGRVYRLTPTNNPPARIPRLRQATSQQLVTELSNPSQWWRLAAHRLLFERQDKAVIPALKNLVREGSEPLGRLHALWTLQGLQGLDEATVATALRDTDGRLRESALLVAELALPTFPKLAETMLTLAGDPIARVRCQAALILGQITKPGPNAALAAILRRDFQFRWTRLAVLSSLASGEDTLLASFLTDTFLLNPPTFSKLELMRELADLAGARCSSGTALAPVLASLAKVTVDPAYQLPVLEGLLAGLSRQDTKVAASASAAPALEQLFRSATPGVKAAVWQLARILRLPDTAAQTEALRQASERVNDSVRPPGERVALIRLLALGDATEAGAKLPALLASGEPVAVQSAALEALRGFTNASLATDLVARWRFLAPATRPPVLNLLLQRRTFHDALLEAIETGQIKVGELNLDLEQRRKLLRQSTPEIAARAARLFGDEEYSNRKTVVTEWLGKLPAAGDATRGRVVFEKTCAQCHLAGGLGQRVGPELTDLSHRSVEDLVSNIIDPNMAINPGYVSYQAELRSGESETGILKGETDSSITLLQATGREVVLSRAQLKSLASTGLSLMPEGLEATMTPAELRDLIAFLQQRR